MKVNIEDLDFVWEPKPEPVKFNPYWPHDLFIYLAFREWKLTGARSLAFAYPETSDYLAPISREVHVALVQELGLCSAYNFAFLYNPWIRRADQDLFIRRIRNESNSSN